MFVMMTMTAVTQLTSETAQAVSLVSLFLCIGRYFYLLELKLLAFLYGTLHILLFISAYCANE